MFLYNKGIKKLKKLELLKKENLRTSLTLEALNKLYSSIEKSKDIPTALGYFDKKGRFKTIGLGGTKRKSYAQICLQIKKGV